MYSYFDKPKSDLTKPYGAWMRDSLKKQTKLIGARRLHDENDNTDRNIMTDEMQGWGTKSDPQNQEAIMTEGKKEEMMIRV